ncbi:hypothetical protein EGR_04733 [Echinococcus granulosus]|uniref:Uncharacterized protein n=1 Tax=Echinococcus granulosus TaxID=6210 RepID=W6UH53_ECHGR|nr:hypothetical protein EGR_04733 [Echinococcus granulosus]EUB60351.1 hypothetical protein EGR_04733 [Echinococcus granulosus]
MSRMFKDVLRVYRRASTGAEAGLAAVCSSPLHPIRLIVSRLVKQCSSSSPPTSTPSTTVPQSCVLLEAAKLVADKSQSVAMATPPTTGADAIHLHEGNVALIVNQHSRSMRTLRCRKWRECSSPVLPAIYSTPTGQSALHVEFLLIVVNLSDQIEGGIVIEEAISDVDERYVCKISTLPTAVSASGFYQAYATESIAIEPGRTSPNHLLNQEEKVLLKNRWRSTLNEDAEIVIWEYTLPSANAPLGISVETLANID